MKEMDMFLLRTNMADVKGHTDAQIEKLFWLRQFKVIWIPKLADFFLINCGEGISGTYMKQLAKK